MNHAQIDNSGAGRGTFRSYGTGFVLSLILTAIAFALVMSGLVSTPVVLFGIAIAAIVQILVHLHFFLHLDSSSTARWNVLALLLTLLIMVLFVGGSIWIMYNLNYRMM
jgi:cytochrome o ubiquinol oxidase operon protein cyoD